MKAAPQGFFVNDNTVPVSAYDFLVEANIGLVIV